MEEKVVSSCSMATNMITLVAKRIDELIKNLKKKRKRKEGKSLIESTQSERALPFFFLEIIEFNKHKDLITWKIRLIGRLLLDERMEIGVQMIDGMKRDIFRRVAVLAKQRRRVMNVRLNRFQLLGKLFRPDGRRSSSVLRWLRFVMNVQSQNSADTEFQIRFDDCRFMTAIGWSHRRFALDGIFSVQLFRILFHVQHDTDAHERFSRFFWRGWLFRPRFDLKSKLFERRESLKMPHLKKKNHSLNKDSNKHIWHWSNITCVC